MTSNASLMVPGFNGGNPIKLLEFGVSTSVRRSDVVGTGLIAGWTGQFDLASIALAQDLNEHLEHTFEEGQSAVSEIVHDAPDGAFRFAGVALSWRGGARFTFRAFSRTPIDRQT